MNIVAVSVLAAIIIFLLTSPVSCRVPLRADSTDEKSQMDKKGSPIQDLLIDNLERIIVFLRILRTGSPNPPIAEVMPNGAGCADCDTVNAFNPFGALFRQLQILVRSMNRYIQAVSKQNNRVTSTG